MSKVMLSQGDIAPDAPILVQLIRNDHPEARATVLITWPGRATEVSPAKLADLVSNATRILSNASLELARRRIVPGKS